MKTALVENEYSKNTELRKEDVAVLQEWVKKQPHLPPISELQIILFLHSCYNSMEMAKATIDKFFTFRAHWPELFTNRNPNTTHTRKSIEITAMIHLPQKTEENYQIVLCKILNCDPNSYHFTDSLKLFDMSFLHWLMKKGTSAGLIIVIDMEGFTFSHSLKLSAMAMKKWLSYLQEALPVRLKQIHFINVKSVVHLLIPLITPFVKKDLLNSLHFHTESSENVFKYVPKECFPKDYGGCAPSYNILYEDEKKELFEDEDYFRADEALVSDESKRVAKADYIDDVFGLDGSFKKLDID